jgi:Tfp pilus assembly protein PilX
MNKHKFAKDYLQSKAIEEKGVAIVVALMFLVILSLLGSAAIMTSTAEQEIAANQKQSKMAFYEADGGTEAGIELLEKAIFQRGFNNAREGNINLVNLQFFMNEDIDDDCPDDLCKPRDSYRDAYYTNIAGNGTVSLKIGGDTQFSTGSAIQMVAGYEGKGKGAARSGSWIMYDVRSRDQNAANSEAVINVRWRHLL